MGSSPSRRSSVSGQEPAEVVTHEHMLWAAFWHKYRNTKCRNTNCKKEVVTHEHMFSFDGNTEIQKWSQTFLHTLTIKWSESESPQRQLTKFSRCSDGLTLITRGSWYAILKPWCKSDNIRMILVETKVSVAGIASRWSSGLEEKAGGQLDSPTDIPWTKSQHYRLWRGCSSLQVSKMWKFHVQHYLLHLISFHCLLLKLLLGTSKNQWEGCWSDI